MQKQKKKRDLRQIRNLGIWSILMLSYQGIAAQSLPNNFIAKLTYNEHKSVRYEFPNNAAIQCLNHNETAEFHDYQQEFNKTEVIDMQGNICSEHLLVFEENVRDAWMTKYTRVLSLPLNTYFYNEEDSLIYHSLLLQDSNGITLSINQGLNFGYFDYNETFYNALKDTLTQNGINFTENNNTLQYGNLIYHATWDQNTKIEMISEKNENGVKIKETTIENEYYEHIHTYQPITKTTVEWILSANAVVSEKLRLLPMHDMEER